MNKSFYFGNTSNKFHFKGEKNKMSIIGIVSEENVENCIRRSLLEKLELRESSVLFLKEKSIENIKNIKFETIILAREFKHPKILKKIIENTPYLIINSDLEGNLELLENIQATVITYGFNSKATITASSVEEEEIMLCIQRAMEEKSAKVIEPQEIKIPLIENVNCTMAVASCLLLYGKII